LALLAVLVVSESGREVTFSVSLRVSRHRRLFTVVLPVGAKLRAVRKSLPVTLASAVVADVSSHRPSPLVFAEVLGVLRHY